jgi:MFS family permease
MADALGRKKSLYLSATCMGIGMFYLGFYVRFSPPVTNEPVPPSGYVALVMVYLFAIAFQLGWGPVCWIYVSEIPTARLRGANIALAAATQWLFNFVGRSASGRSHCSLSFPHLKKDLPDE